MSAHRSSAHPGILSLLVILLSSFHAAKASADEFWVAPTSQQDLGGLEVASNAFWPVTPIGAVRFAFSIPNDLLAFQNAKVVLIPHAGGAATLNVFVCQAESGGAVIGACAGPTAMLFTGVANQLAEVDISAAVAPKIGTPGATYLAILAFTTPTTVTDHVVGLRFAYSPVPPSNVATLGANTFAGIQTAPGFVGDGANVTGVNAALLDGLDSTAFSLTTHGHDVSQITNAARLAGGNAFTGTQTIDAGNLDLDASTAATGNITKNGTRFLHNSGGAFNTFLGEDAGNFTMTGANNTGVGRTALASNTTGGSNTAMGLSALFSNTTGPQNAAFGWSALSTNTGGGSNAAFGFRALVSNVNGGGNVAVGADALRLNTIGGNNTGIGFMAGANGTTGTNNIYLGANVFGVAGESSAIYIGTQGLQNKTTIAGIRGVATLNPDAIPVLIDSAGQLGTISSSRRFKEDIHDMADSSHRLFKLHPVTFRYIEPFANGAKPIQFGLIAEEVAEVFPELAVRKPDGQVETVHYETLNVLLLNEVQKQQRELEAQRERIAVLEQRLNELTAQRPGDQR
jgi:endosialidase-like protein